MYVIHCFFSFYQSRKILQKICRRVMKKIKNDERKNNCICIPYPEVMILFPPWSNYVGKITHSKTMFN